MVDCRDQKTTTTNDHRHLVAVKNKQHSLDEMKNHFFGK
jgi:hypothetical protein